MKIKDMSPKGQRAYRYARQAKLNLRKAMALIREMPVEDRHTLREQTEEVEQMARRVTRRDK